MSQERARRGLFTFAAAVVILAGLKAAAAIVVPVLLAMFLAFVSSPLVFRLSARIPYRVAVSIVLFVQVLILSTMGVLVAQSAGDLQGRLPALREGVAAAQADAVRWLADHAGLRVNEAAALVDTGPLVQSIGDAAVRVGSLLGSAVLMVLVLAFTLFDASRLWRMLDERLGPHELDRHVVSRVSVEINRYLTIKTSISLVTGLLAGSLCVALRVDFPILWGLLAFLLNYIPNVGSVLAAVPPVLVAWVMQGPSVALLVAGGYLAINMLFGNILEPKLMGTALGISPVVVLLSIVLWGWLLGPVGALLSAPLTVIVKIALANTREWAWVAELMSNPRRQDQRPVPRPNIELEDKAAGPEPHPR